MSTYVFKAMDLAGIKARGELEAESKQAVSDQLKQRGLIVLDIADKHASREIELSFMKSSEISLEECLALMSRTIRPRALSWSATTCLLSASTSPVAFAPVRSIALKT